jgi:NADH:ubiquinone oxidoreductase subunit H
VIPAWLVLLSALVVMANVLVVALFIMRWERRAGASRQVEESPGTAGRDDRWQPSAPDQADTRADALSG